MIMRPSNRPATKPDGNSSVVKLIRLVKANPVIWDKNNLNYRKRDLTNACWEIIARKMNDTVPNVKATWNATRNYYKRKGSAYYLKPHLDFLPVPEPSPRQGQNGSGLPPLAQQLPVNMVWNAGDIYTDSEDEEEERAPPPAHSHQQSFSYQQPTPGPSHRLNDTPSFPLRMPKTEFVTKREVIDTQHSQRAPSMPQTTPVQVSAAQVEAAEASYSGERSDSGHQPRRPRASMSGKAGSGGKKISDEFVKNIIMFMERMSPAQKDMFKDGVYALIAKVQSQTDG